MICRLNSINPGGENCEPTTLASIASRKAKFVTPLSSECHLAVKNRRCDLHPGSMIVRKLCATEGVKRAKGPDVWKYRWRETK